MYFKHKKIQILAILLFSFVGTIMLFITDAQESTISKPVQNGYAPIFDYGQRDGSFYQPSGSVFSGTMLMQTNYSHIQPQQTIIHLGYDSTRVEITSVKCLTQWGCYASQIDNETYLYSKHRPYVNVCINIPSGTSPVSQLFSVTFKAKSILGETSNWWDSSFGEAPGSCESNPRALNFIKNMLGGSGVCDGPFDPCDRGPGPGNLNYEGFGSAGQAGTQAQSNGQSNTVSNGQGGSSSANSIVTKVNNQPLPVPTSSPQGDTPDKPKVEPSPFFDGKEYGKESEPTQAASFGLLGNSINYRWILFVLTFTVLVLAGGFIWVRNHK